MSEKEVKCIICGKVAPPATIGKSIRFFIDWIEYLPGQWMCRNCKESTHDKNLVRYKLQFFSDESIMRK